MIYDIEVQQAFQRIGHWKKYFEESERNQSLSDNSGSDSDYDSDSDQGWQKVKKAQRKAKTPEVSSFYVFCSSSVGKGLTEQPNGILTGYNLPTKAGGTSGTPSSSIPDSDSGERAIRSDPLNPFRKKYIEEFEKIQGQEIVRSDSDFDFDQGWQKVKKVRRKAKTSGKILKKLSRHEAAGTRALYSSLDASFYIFCTPAVGNGFAEKPKIGDANATLGTQGTAGIHSTHGIHGTHGTHGTHSTQTDR